MSDFRHYKECIVVSGDDIVHTTQFPKDARSWARDFVKRNPGTRVRIYKGEETVFSFVGVDDDLPKAADPRA